MGLLLSCLPGYSFGRSNRLALLARINRNIIFFKNFQNYFPDYQYLPVPFYIFPISIMRCSFSVIGERVTYNGVTLIAPRIQLFQCFL